MRGFHALVVIVGACSGGQPHRADNRGGSGVTSGSGSAGDAAVAIAGPDASAEVIDSATAKRAMGTQTSARGTAEDAKLAAAVILADGTPVYCLGTDSWPKALRGKIVVATGLLESTDEFVARPGAAGTSGPVWVLRGCSVAAP